MEKRTPKEMEELRRRILLDIPENYDQIELKHCPLCKSESTIEEMLRRYYAKCTKCGCNGPLMASVEEAKQAWETRYA